MKSWNGGRLGGGRGDGAVDVGVAEHRAAHAHAAIVGAGCLSGAPGAVEVLADQFGGGNGLLEHREVRGAVERHVAPAGDVVCQVLHRGRGRHGVVLAADREQRHGERPQVDRAVERAERLGAQRVRLVVDVDQGLERAPPLVAAHAVEEAGREPARGAARDERRGATRSHGCRALGPAACVPMRAPLQLMTRL